MAVALSQRKVLSSEAQGRASTTGIGVGANAVAVAEWREVGQRVRPVVLAEEQLLAVLSPFEALLPQPGLRRGSTIVVSGGPGAVSLAFALIAGPSAAGSWCAAVGGTQIGTSPGAGDSQLGLVASESGPQLGLLAAAELGVVLERFALVSTPPASWATAVAALIDAFDVVLAWLPPRLRPAETRRLMARARERGAVLVVMAEATGPRAPRPGAPRARVEGADVHLMVTASRWYGLGQGHGHLVGRQVEAVACGRGVATRERRARLWLPAPRGGLAVAPSEAR